jgi:hypothetical protein
MNRALRVTTAVMLAVQAAMLLFGAVVLGRMLMDHHMSMAGGDPAHARAALWVFAFGYLALALVSVPLLVPDAPRGWLRRLRRPVLLSAVVVNVPIVMLSLTLSGWPAFGWTVVLLTLLTAALFAGWDGTGWGAAGGVKTRAGSTGP